LVPPHNYGPPERCYYETVVDRPGFVIHPFGRGRAIHVPWLPGQLFHRQGHTNTIDFAADLIEHVAGVAPVGGNLSPMVEVTLLESRASGTQLLHLVNGSGHFGTTFYAPVSMSDLVVSLPPGLASRRGCAVRPSSVTSLVTGEPVAFVFEEGALSITVPKLDLFEALQIAWQ
jgi:hypothetical protein